jgi:hypothetical protein
MAASRIYAIWHKNPDVVPWGNLFLNYVLPSAPLPGELDGIMCDNSFAEMRAMYHVWRRGKMGFETRVGFQHYRRLFFFDQFDATGSCPLDQYLSKTLYYAEWRDPMVRCREDFAQHTHKPFIDLSPVWFHAYRKFLFNLPEHLEHGLDTWLGSFDIVVPRPWHWSVAEHFIRHHSGRAWSVFIEVLAEQGIRWPAGFDTFYPCNMFVMSWEEFDRYMMAWWKVAEKLRSRLPDYRGTANERMIGFLSERYFSLWLYARRCADPLLKIAEVPHVFCSAYVNQAGD